MTTPTEKRILQKRATAERGDVLTPIMEKLLEHEVIPEDGEDFAFIQMLLRVRAVPRSKGVFSPSMLGSCMRQSWFAKRGEKKWLVKDPQMNGYFLKGNFVHFQWQFALWKAHRKGLLELVTVPSELPGGGYRLGVEVRVIDKDFGGTIDALVKIDGIVYIIDFKGINLVEFQKQVRSGAKEEYRRQIVGYAIIANRVLDLDIQDCLLVAECKAGPLNQRGSSPIALHETRVLVSEFQGDVKRRLKSLKFYDFKDKMPPAECVSTRHMRYCQCPFNRHCHEEVKTTQRELESRTLESKRDWKVARPPR